MTRALIFDFDGLILDTETPDYESWQEIYRSYGCPLPLSTWAQYVGSRSIIFDPYDYLEQQLGEPIDRAAIRARRRARYAELMAGQSILPGVEQYILEAKRAGLKLGLASSASRAWVLGNLGQLELTAHFDAVKCADDVEQTKPDPALYLETLRALDVKAWQAIALEDSPNGVEAAKRAGIFCVAVPNALTRHFAFERADLRLASLAELPLPELLLRAGGRRPRLGAGE